ncbi:MAG: hypothetical protein ABI083_08190 [Lapillicoccus sp.]
MSTSFEEQLREQLHATTPAPYAGLDPAAVIGAGRRVVRRRRIGAALVAAVAVAVVAVGSQLVTTGRPDAAPLPAAPSGISSLGTAHLSIAPNRQPERSYTVVLSPNPDDKGRTRVTWTQDGVAGSVGFSVDPADPRAAWSTGGNSPFVLGLVHDAAAGSSISVATDRDYGFYASLVKSVPGTGWSAFVLAFEKPLASYKAITSMLWFDHGGRPVDQTGEVGSTTTVDGRRVWLTRDGGVLGVVQGDGISSTPLPGQALSSFFGDYPRVVMSTDTAGSAWTLTLRLRPEAVRATLVLADGRRLPVTPVRLGNWSVASTTVAGGVASAASGVKTSAPVLARVEWTTVSGVQHDDVVPSSG